MPACGKTGRKPDVRAQGCRRKASENQMSPDISLVREEDLRTPQAMGGELRGSHLQALQSWLWHPLLYLWLHSSEPCLCPPWSSEMLRGTSSGMLCFVFFLSHCYCLFSLFFFFFIKTSSAYVAQLTSYSRSSYFRVVSTWDRHHTELQE